MKNGITSIEIEEIENYLSYIRPSKKLGINLILGIELKSKASSFFEVSWIDPKKTENKIAKVTFVKERSLESVLATRRFKMAFL
jgi:hypothetical protein